MEQDKKGIGGEGNILLSSFYFGFTLFYKKNLKQSQLIFAPSSTIFNL